ncbi:hypothetical protein SEVIR_7G034458v4 [Setaria viridis]|uniref:Disease resistance protein At4g27190-like leucine-rich repeats domain-containing protein n=1 Tax=Setaria viridis TaxID=4556 RepID=A0A4U6TQF2_SETVI|nr:uncharacterized protein LOC117862807 [Setaria viridis]TKW02879.1 hypothetical protein SEVIR_7G034458v2 [Setaria viridis]
MPRLLLGPTVYRVQAAVERIIRFLEDTGTTAHKAIYFDGWDGLAASAVLRAIAEDPPPSLKKKFDKILHIDCSMWKSRRALQRAIADELNLTQRVMAAFNRQDEEDDFRGVDEGSRAEIGEVGLLITESLLRCRYLVVFHNGSNDTVDLASCGIPRPEFLGSKILWTFRGRLRLNPQVKDKVDSSHLYIYRPIDWSFDHDTAKLILDEATEIVKSIQHKQSITPTIAAKCISYILWLINQKGGGTMDYDWTTHASNYWVCDGIIEEGQSDDDSWELSTALHQQIRLEDCSSPTVKFSGHEYREQWKSVIEDPSNIEEGTSSYFLSAKNGLSLPPKMFQQSYRLRVLKLSGCNFSFYSPPFCCCHSLRFLGLEKCKDQPQEEEDRQRRPTTKYLHSLWVLDVRNMDWELDLLQDSIEQMAVNIREIHVKNGRIWRSNLAWGQLQNLCKLRVIKLLDLYGNNAIQVLPSLCGATGLKTLILDGCAELDHVGPGLPPSLESFSFDAGAGDDGRNTAKISRITLAGCPKLVEFRLLGSLSKLEELDLSGTPVKILDLKKEIQVQNLQRIFLIGCKQLRSIIWPEKRMEQLRLLCIDTRQELVLTETSRDSLVCPDQEKYCHARVSATDMRFFQSLVRTDGEEFRWITTPFKLNLNPSCTSNDDGIFISRTKKHVRSSNLHKPLISMACLIYNDISIEEIATNKADGSSALQFEPQDLHVEIGQGAINTEVLNPQSTSARAISFMMDRVMSLHVHDSCSITTIIPKHIASATGQEIHYPALKWCRVEKCPKLEVVFHTNYDGNDYWFEQLETFWAADLLMARSIWSRGRPLDGGQDRVSFSRLRAIHLHMCPRLQFVLPLSWRHTLSSLETIHIVCCRDLKQVFLVESGFLERVATRHPNGMLKFPKLKHLYLHDLSCLQQICEAKIFAPELETIRIRGCWGLRRLPATDRHRRHGRLVAVDCEKDWWDNLEWDGLDVGHQPSLFAPRHPTYYKKRLLRTTVLR